MRCFILFLLSLRILSSPATIRADDAEHFFESRIRPVLIQKCFKCHGSEKTSGGLRVDSLEALLKGGETRAAIVPGKPEDSLLIQAITRTGDYEMPPDETLPAQTVDDFRQWIRNGAVWPKTGPGVTDTAFSAQRHWAFLPIESPAVPAIRHTEHSRNAIDRFILHKLEAAGLEPSPDADRSTLIRRVMLDLTGLPPTFQEVQDFLADTAPDAYEQLVERCLASPRYGERWGRHWLDLARYADTKGYVFQEERKYPFAYTYRDWVIRSLNADLPYDEFLIRQMAADWRVNEGLDQSELAAMGFLTLGRRFLNNTHDIIDDRIDVVTRGTMGLTVSCARCHDHKYDPVPQADYYSLYGVFASSHEPKVDGAMPLAENDQPHNPVVFLRGAAGNRGPAVPRQFLEVVAGPDRKPFAKGSGRLELAQAIASPQNPLTARVIVNRIWLQHFHSPLVRTPSDFGLRCDPPTHPELLNWLAARLIETGWSLKSLHRDILLSATYRQSSHDEARQQAVDPENRLLWRMNRGRLELEPMRDAILTVAGGLDPQMNGPAVDLTAAPATRRRSIYGFIDRQNLPALFRTFDFAGPDAHSPGRFQTTVPQQTLYLRNSPFLIDEARRLSRSLKGQEPDARIQELFQRVLSRNPDRSEMDLARAFLNSSTNASGPVPLWQYGYGPFDAATGKLASFTHLPHYTGKGWQGGPELPDPRLGYVLWRAGGGHPGDADKALVLRWVAPQALTVRVIGTVKHPKNEGDGVRITVSSARRGRLAQWTARNGEVPTDTEPFEVEASEVVDLIVDNNGTTTHDGFQWNPIIEQAGTPSVNWNPSRDIRGPVPESLDNWSMLAQVLLLSNEFQFVD